MPKVTFVQPDGSSLEVDGAIGQSVMIAAIMNDVPGILAECGGSCVCGTCHVYIEASDVSRLPEVADSERALLDILPDRPHSTSRLCCQIPMTESLDGLTVHIPEPLP